MERDFALSLTHSVTHSFVVLQLECVCNDKNKTKHNQDNYNSTINHFKCIVLCGSLCAYFVCNHTHIHFLPLSPCLLFLPILHEHLSVCVHTTNTSFDQIQEANKENQFHVHMFRWQKAHNFSFSRKTNICKSTLVDHAYEMLFAKIHSISMAFL